MNTRSPRAPRRSGFTLVEIMIVVLIIGVLLNIALPNFVAARETARARACVGNLKQIDSACQQYALDNKLAGTALWSASVGSTGPSGIARLSGVNGYIRVTPTCPELGTYNLGTTVLSEPYCTISDGTAHGSGGGTATLPSYGVGATWYHGLSN